MASRSKFPKSKSRKHGLSLGDKVIVGVVLLALIAAAYYLTQPAQPSSTTTRSSSAPDFTLPVVSRSGLTGQQVSLSSLRGKVVLLEFMVPWCSHCQNMAPVLESLYKQYSSQNVVFVSVSGNWQGATVDDAAKFIRDYASSWTYAYDGSNNVFNAYGVTGTPTFFVIGKDGSIRASYSGEVRGDTLAADISRLIG